MLCVYQEGMSVGTELLHIPPTLKLRCHDLRSAVSAYFDKYKPTTVHPGICVGLVGMLCKEQGPALDTVFDWMGQQAGRQAVLIDAGEPGIPTVWALDWPEGEPTPIHDHADSVAGICVFRGQVFNDVYYPLGDAVGEFDVLQTHTVLTEHMLVSCPNDYIHQVGGISKYARAATVHAYYDKLDWMRFYHHVDGKLHQAGEWKESGIM